MPGPSLVLGKILTRFLSQRFLQSMSQRQRSRLDPGCLAVVRDDLNATLRPEKTLFSKIHVIFHTRLPKRLLREHVLMQVTISAFSHVLSTFGSIEYNRRFVMQSVNVIQ